MPSPYAASEARGRVGIDAAPPVQPLSRAMPHHARYLFVCTNRRPDGHPKGSCAAAGSEELVPKLKAAVAELGGKGVVRACSSGCLDLCEIGAAILQEPEHVAYGRVTAGDLREIAAAALRGEVVDRLVVYRGG